MKNMKKIWRISSGLSVLTAAMVLAGCDWSSGGGASGYNTSQGAGVNINFSGVYRGELSGGRAVSGENITTLTIAQTGNRLTAVDNNGSRYEGSVGSPGLVASASNGAFPAGAELVQGQVNFSGVNNATGRKIQFAGVVHVVAVTDVQGETSSDSNSSSSQESKTDTKVVNDGTNTISTTTVTVGSPGDPLYLVTTTVVVKNNQTGEEISRTETTSGSSERTVTTNFSIDASNANYRMEGTWVEEGGGTSSFKARSPGTSGLIQTTTTATTDTGAATQ